LARAREQTTRAGHIVERIRGFGKRGNNERQIEALSPLIKEAVELALLGVRQKGVRIEFVDGAPNIRILADKIEIQQVLTNLVRNAAEAVADRDHPSIAVRAEVRNGTVRISVSDNGPGLPDQVQAKLFQPFVTTKKTGMGVGLSISHSIITDHGGRLWAEPGPTEVPLLSWLCRSLMSRPRRKCRGITFQPSKSAPSK
jgi:two-component system, LuxR family, sensor kinase FixL